MNESEFRQPSTIKGSETAMATGKKAPAPKTSPKADPKPAAAPAKADSKAKKGK
jgi:hypothetical protein